MSNQRIWADFAWFLALSPEIPGVHFTVEAVGAIIAGMGHSLRDDGKRSAAQVDSPRRGIVELICGCMFSGKTTALLDALSDEPDGSVMVFKHGKDDRYSRSQIVTHDGQAREAVTVTCARDIVERLPVEIEVVAIDEGHFYDDDLPAICAELAKSGKRVIVTTLDRDMWGLEFSTIQRVREISGLVLQQTARCAKCGEPATHTHRKTPIINRNLVGGAADFEPRCRRCWSPPPEEHIASSEMA